MRWKKGIFGNDRAAVVERKRLTIHTSQAARFFGNLVGSQQRLAGWFGAQARRPCRL